MNTPIKIYPKIAVTSDDAYLYFSAINNANNLVIGRYNISGLNYTFAEVVDMERADVMTVVTPSTIFFMGKNRTSTNINIIYYQFDNQPNSWALSRGCADPSCVISGGKGLVDGEIIRTVVSMDLNGVVFL